MSSAMGAVRRPAFLPEQPGSGSDNSPIPSPLLTYKTPRLQAMPPAMGGVRRPAFLPEQPGSGRGKSSMPSPLLAYGSPRPHGASAVGLGIGGLDGNSGSDSGGATSSRLATTLHTALGNGDVHRLRKEVGCCRCWAPLQVAFRHALKVVAVWARDLCAPSGDSVEDGLRRARCRPPRRRVEVEEDNCGAGLAICSQWSNSTLSESAAGDSEEETAAAGSATASKSSEQQARFML